MLPLFIGLILIIAGLGTVAWLMWNEQKQLSAQEAGSGTGVTGASPKPDITPEKLLKKLGLEEEKSAAPEQSSAKKNLFSKLPQLPQLSTLFKFLPSLKKSPKEDAVIVTPLPSKLPEEFNRVSAKNAPTGIGTASLRLDHNLSAPPPAAVSEKINTPTPALTGLEAESDWAFRYDELQKERDSFKEKFERLDALFKEKGDAFDKSEKALTSEIKNRKEFNKVKDVLEKELKESRDKSRELEVRITASQTESSAYLKRITQLEEKIKKIEKEILENEESMKEAQGQIQGRQKLIADLEEKVKAQEKLVQEKNEKINAIVDKMKEGGSSSLPPEAAPAEQADQPAAPMTEIPIPATEEPPPPPVPVAEEAVPAVATIPEVTTPEQPAPVVEPAPAAVSEAAPEAPVQPPISEPEPPSPEPPIITESKIEPLPEPVLEESPKAPEAEPPPAPAEEPAPQDPPAERGNIILQAIEKAHQPVPEDSPKELKDQVPDQAEPQNMLSPEQQQPETPQEAPTENPPADTLTLKLAPDIMAPDQPQTNDAPQPAENPSEPDKNEPPKT